MKKENKIRLIVEADEKDISVCIEGGLLKTIFALASLYAQSDTFRKIIDKAIDIANEKPCSSEKRKEKKE